MTFAAPWPWCPGSIRPTGPRVSYGTPSFRCSDAGVPLGDIAQLVGHSGTTVTELVYRHQIRPVIQTGATVMDRLFGHRGSGA